MGNINSSNVAEAPKGDASKSARTENKSPHPDKAPAGSANESTKTEINRSHTTTIGSEANEVSTAPLGSANKSARTATKSPRGKKMENCGVRPKDPGVRTCGG